MPIIGIDGEDWLAHARAAYERAVEADDHVSALAHASRTLHRIDRELGAAPAMEFWLDAIDREVAPWASAPPPHVAPLLFEAGLAILSRRPAHPALPLWQGRALACLRSSTADASDALRAAHFAFEYAVRGGQFGVAREIVERARPHSERAAAPVRARWLEAEALQAWLSADHRRARALVVRALRHGAGYGAWEQGASAALSEGDLARADRCLAVMARTVDPRRVQDVAHGDFLGAARARLGGDTRLAAERIDASMAADATSVALYFATLWQLGRAHVSIARGLNRRASGDLSTVVARASSLYWKYLHFSALLARTWLRIHERRTADARDDLREALALARVHAYRNADPWWDPEAIAEIQRFASGVDHDGFTLDALATRSLAQ